MKSIEMTARTTEEAISAGLEELGVSLSDVHVEIVEEGSKGLFGFFGSRPAKVRLTLSDESSEDEVHEIFAHSLANQSEQKRDPEPEPSPALAEKPAKAAAKKTSSSKKSSSGKKAEKPEQAKPAASEETAKPASQPKKSESKKAREAKPVEPAKQLDPATLAGKAQDFLNNVTRLMGVETQVHMTTDDEGYLHADLQGDTSGILIGRRGETLDALQHLTSLYINKGKSEYTRITLDTENYRARREDTLIRLANRYANRCIKTGRRVSVEPMNPYERRIMHSALQENEFVDTHSEGEEPNRHIVITPRKQSDTSAAE